MATLVFTAKHIVRTGTATITYYYDTAETGDTFTLTVNSVTVKVDSYRAWHNAYPYISQLSWTGSKATINANGSKSWTINKSATIRKTHSSQSVSVWFSFSYQESGDDYPLGPTKELKLAIPAKTTYTVTLNANGGSGGTTSLVKWHGEPLDLTTGFTAPTRQGYLFYGWSATQEDAAAGITVSNYTVNDAATFYACWKPAIENARITSVDVVRVDNSSSMTESDDGEYCYGRVGFSMEGEAAGTVGIVVTIDPPILDSNHDPITPSFTFTKQAGLPLSDVASFHVPGCDLSTKYLFTATATFTNSDYADQVISDSTLGDYLSIAFFTWDALADGFPGQRPGHGFAFGQQSVIEGLCVAMDLMVRPWAGVIQMFAGSIPPAGWLLCDGSAVSRTTYATLYAAIGDTWGAGDGSTTFNLPDLRGRAPIGAGAGSGLTARTLGNMLGSEAMQAHTHGKGSLAITASGGHTHTVKGYGKDLGSGSTGYRFGSGGSETVGIGMNSPTHTHPNASFTGSTGSYGSGDSQNMQPSAVVNFIIHTGKTS